MEDSGKKAGNKKLRKKAEELHKEKSPDVHSNLSDVDTLKLIHELEVHQIELEMQYDEIEIAKIAIQVEAEKYRDLYDFAPTGFFTLSNKTIITELNHAGAKMLGKERSHVINKMFGLFVSEKSRPDYNQFIEKIFNSSKKEICEIKLSTNGQSHLILTGFASPTKGHCIVNAVDITEKVVAQQKLKESEELHRITLENINDPVFITKDDGTFTFICPNVEKNLGYTANEIAEMGNISELLGENLFDLNELKPDKDIENIERKLTDKNGKAHTFLVSVKRVSIKGGTILYVCHDITERKNTENVLKKYKEIVSSTTDAIALLDKNYQYIIVNDAYESFSNIKSEQLVGKTVEEYLGTDIFQNEIKAHFDKCLAGEKVNYQHWYYHQKRGNRFIDVNYFPFREKENEITGVVAVRRDITESKKAEQVKSVLYNISNAVTNTENLKTLIGQIQIELGRIIDITNFHIAFYDKKTDTISLPFFTNTKVDMPSVRRGKTLTRYLVGQKKPLLIDEAKIKELRKNNEIMEFVADPEIWLGVPLMFEGELTGVLAVQSYTNKNAYNESDLRMLEFVSDQISISIHRKQAEDALKFEQNRLRTLIDNLPDAIYVKDELGRKVIANLADVENIGAASESDVLGKNDLELFPGEIGQKCYNEDMNVLQTGNPLLNKEEYFLKDGVKNWMLTTKIPLFDEQRKIIGLVGIGRNITKQKQAEKDLIEAKEQAEESDRLKSAFLANMSHEIRTPMNGILGFSDLLKTPQLSGEEQHRYIEIIEKSGKRMLNTINNIIDISKIEAGEMQVSLSKFDIREQVESIVLFFTPEAQRLGVELIVKNNLDKKECFLYSDEEKIYAIFTNLVKNALKYCTDGHIEIGMDKKENEYQFYVKDTGKGIPEERQQAIFERFIQADIEDREAMQGSGLGLAISKSYIEMLGGKIWLKSKEGHGTTFYYTILAKTAPGENKIPKEADTTKESSENIKKLKILIAEDDQVSGMVMEAMVKKYSSTILTATNGEETVRLYKQNPDIDLIFMDIRMPILDGYEATRKIREFDTDVIIIAQTAFALSGDRERAIKAGCNDYLAKPINKTELNEILKKYFH